MDRFRSLRADELDCRVGTCNDKGFSLLLYKDARCDQNVLDETVGKENWQSQRQLVLRCVNLGREQKTMDNQMGLRR